MKIRTSVSVVFAIFLCLAGMVPLINARCATAVGQGAAGPAASKEPAINQPEPAEGKHIDQLAGVSGHQLSGGLQASAAVHILQLTQPPAIVERTATVSVEYSLTYDNGSYVKTSTNVIRVRAVTRGGQVVAGVPLSLANESAGVWVAAWVPVYSSNLTEYSFVLNPTEFSDAYGNLGEGQPIVSSSFTLVPADITLQIQAQSLLNRTRPEQIIIPAKYHDGTDFKNITHEGAGIYQPNGSLYPLNFTFVGATMIVGFEAPANATLGSWNIDANITDVYGNHAKGEFEFQVAKANFKVVVPIPDQVQRTTRLNVTAQVTYLDDKPVKSGMNGTVTFGNSTQLLNLAYVAPNQTWIGGYYITQNATLGNYNVTIWGMDDFGNGARFTMFVLVVPAAFVITPPAQSAQAPPLELADVAVSVNYPNGSALTNQFGEVIATYQNSTGGSINTILNYNSTDMRWHTLFLTPDQRFKLFSTTITFSFVAKDIYGNYGSLLNGYAITVTTPPQLLIVAAVAGIILPVILLAWAILTISKRRRKHRALGSP